MTMKKQGNDFIILKLSFLIFTRKLLARVISPTFLDSQSNFLLHIWTFQLIQVIWKLYWSYFFLKFGHILHLLKAILQIVIFLQTFLELQYLILFAQMRLSDNGSEIIKNPLRTTAEPSPLLISLGRTESATLLLLQRKHLHGPKLPSGSWVLWVRLARAKASRVRTNTLLVRVSDSHPRAAQKLEWNFI